MSTETLIDAALQTSVDPALQTSIDESTETSIDDTPPEAGKFSLTNHANEEVVLGSEPSREKERSNTGEAEKATINLDQEEEESGEDVEIDRQEGNNVDRLTTDFNALSSQQVAN
ncbi:hypothetical protein DY000_02040240 [Brassica cretica]|uniref:Uncharacterized protein n=1 Tax=Brassica cretica TaxID=69181 RepID=A0ABQ7BB20_BRACR|nr:hypothetical protein DY000_02040240 [Brassica cretica]